MNERMKIIYNIIETILSKGSSENLPKLTIDKLLETDGADNIRRKNEVEIVLTLFEFMGLLSEDDGVISPVSRYAYFALRSLEKFAERGLTVVGPAEHSYSNAKSEEDQFLIAFTKGLENIRSSMKEVGIDQSPIHGRRIVNILIKGRHVRGWRRQDVFLHKYHVGWDAYHLIGLSQKKPDESDEVLIEKAMKIHLGLDREDYKIDHSHQSREIKLKRVSATSGALTEYTYIVYGIKFTKKRIEIPKEKRDTLRWFTLDEVKGGRGTWGEKIMFSSPELFKQLDLASWPVNSRLPDFRLSYSSIVRELGNRMTWQDVMVVVVLLLFPLTIWGVHEVFPGSTRFLYEQHLVLSNIANVIDIVSVLSSVIYAAYKVLGR